MLRSSGSQHSSSLEGLFTHLPGLKVVAPSNPADAKGLLLSAIEDPDPVIYLEHKKITAQRGPVPIGDHRVPLGSAAVTRAGSDVTVVAYSAMALNALAAAAQLAEEGIEAEVIDLRSLVPLDFETVLESVSRTRRAVVAHEAWRFGGFGPSWPRSCTPSSSESWRRRWPASARPRRPSRSARPWRPQWCPASTPSPPRCGL